jgi:uncharacterized protein (DUF1697 family)
VARHVVLLRGVNIVRRNRVSMPELRQALEAAGYVEIRTHLQSGNVILSSRAPAKQVVDDVKSVIKKHFGLDITVLVRSHAELAASVRRNPLEKVATDPSRYLVTFLSGRLPGRTADELRKIAQRELFAVAGREIYSWHPEGIGRTPLWERLASRSLGIDSTSRNWATATRLLAMAEAPDDR